MADTPKRRWAKRLKQPQKDADDDTAPPARNTSDGFAVEIATDQEMVTSVRGSGKESHPLGGGRSASNLAASTDVSGDPASSD